MVDLQTPIEELRERLTGLLADWGAELSMVLRELETKRARLAELESRVSSSDEQVEALNSRIEEQARLIESLSTDAEGAANLRREVTAKTAEVERLSSELDSKQELIRALRRDADSLDRAKADVKAKDQEIAALKADKRRSEQHAEKLAAEVEALKQANETGQQNAELEAVKAELEARKTLIKSLRADAERVISLEAHLDERREVIAKLEASINRHASTIAELKRIADVWKERYHTLKGGSSNATTATDIPAFSDTDLRAIETLHAEDVQKGDRTIAIDMRQSLLEARRTARRAHGKE